MNSQLVDFEGNFGSQDPALQPTAEDFAALSEYLKVHRAENEELLEAYRRQASENATLQVSQESPQAA